eukprot:jgi/Ulvmu1/4156/UM019_0135.1
MKHVDVVSANSFSSASNSKLKERIRGIKDGHLVTRSDSVGEQAESHNMAQLHLRHEQVEREQGERIKELKVHLASVIDRTTRIRTAYDKEKRQLMAQVERLNARLRQNEESWQAKLTRADQTHAQALNARDRDICLLRQQFDDALRATDLCKAEMNTERIQLEEHFRRDLKSKEEQHAACLRHAHEQEEHASAALHAERQVHMKTKQELETEKMKHETLNAQLRAVTQNLRELQNLHNVAQTEIGQWKHIVKEQKNKHQHVLVDAAAAAEKRLKELGRSRMEEMEQIHSKLKDVLQRKNDTIQRLQQSLDEANGRISLYEEDIHFEKIKVLEQMKW